MVNIADRIENFVAGFWVAAAGAIVSACVWLVRTILTNQKALGELRAEIRARENARAAERQMIMDLKTDIREIKGDVKHLYARGYLEGQKNGHTS